VPGGAGRTAPLSSGFFTPRLPIPRLLQVTPAPQGERAEARAQELTMEQRELEMRTVLSRKASDEASQAQQAAHRTAAELRQALQEERDNAERLARELATARRELGSQAAALPKAGDKAAPNQQLTEWRQALQQAEWLSAKYQEMLAQERARNRGLEEQLAARQDATPVGGRNVPASLSDTPDPTRATATGKPATAPLPANDKPMTPADDKLATATRPTAPEAARSTTPEAPSNPEPARLMARASLLLDQGNIGVARIVLERAADGAPSRRSVAARYRGDAWLVVSRGCRARAARPCRL
jgi:hypothetical protein